MNECLLFRRRMYELLIEPKSSPSWLIRSFEKHQKECRTCRDFFEESQRKQRRGAMAIESLPLNNKLREIMAHDCSSAKMPKKWLVAAVVFIAASSTFAFNFFEKQHHNNKVVVKTMQECQFSKELASYFTDSTNNAVNSKAYLFDLISQYTVQVEKEFAALKALIKTYQSGPYGPQLEKNLRDMLIDSQSYQKLTALQLSGYPESEIKSLFIAPVNNIHDQDVLLLFHKALPHLLNIWNSRSIFVNRINKSEIDRCGGEAKFLSFIGSLENNMCF